MKDTQTSAEQLLTYADKIAQSHKEAKATVVALVLTIVAWAVLGFGLAGIDVKIAGMPLWALGGTVGTWIVAVLIVVIMNKTIFRDFNLDDEGVSQDAAVNGGTNE